MADDKNPPDIRRCLQEYRRNMSEDLQALWKIWVPATLINFAFSKSSCRLSMTTMET